MNTVEFDLREHRIPLTNYLKQMKTSSDFGIVQNSSSNVLASQPSSTQNRAQKFDRTQRFSKQLSLAAQPGFNQKGSVVSTKSIVRHSENAHVHKTKTLN